MPRHLFGRLLLVITGLVLSITAIAAPSPSNPGDVLRIDVWNEESLSREVLVRPDGLISLPMAGEVDTTADPGPGGREDLKALGNYIRKTPRGWWCR